MRAVLGCLWRGARALLLALAMLLAGPAVQGGIVVVGTSTGKNEGLPVDGTPGALVLPRPAGVKPGMALVASIAARPSLMDVVVPSGWQLMTFTDQPDGGLATLPYGSTMVTYYKIATTTEPATYTWTFANSYNEGGMVVGAIMAITGIDTSSGNPIDNNGAAWSAHINSAGLTHSTSTISTVTPNTTIVSSLSYNSATSFGAPSGISGITEIIDLTAPTGENAGISLQMSTAFRAATGTVGPVSATAIDYDDYGIGHLMAMQPSGIDPELTMTRNSALNPGGSTSYTLTTQNIGLASEPGPLTIINTLPSGLTYSSASGTGWSCSAAGQTVTCSRSGALASGATAPALTINVTVGGAASGPMTNTATVSGTGGDGNTYNNTAVNTYVIPSYTTAYYAMDEAAWGTVTDATGNGHTGSKLGSASPTGSLVPSPPGAAIPGTTGTCGVANIPSGTTAIGVGTGLDVNTLGSAGSMAFWYSSNSAWNDGNSRMLIDASADLGASDRHFFIAKNGAGALVFSFQDSAGTTLTATTSSYGFNGQQWHHIAVTWTANGTAKIYLDGTEAASATASLNSTLGAVTTVYIGAQRMAGVTGTPSGYTANTANGYIDEVRIYGLVLQPLEIEAMTTWTHTCTAGIHHYELSLPTTAISCLPSTVTVTACIDSSSPCTNKATTINGQTASLGASAGALAASTVTFDATGVATTTLRHGTAANGTVVTVSLSGEQALATQPRQCCPNGVSCAAGNSCSVTFSQAGLLFDVPHHRAESSTPVTITAVKTSDNSSACAPAFTSVTKPLTLACSYLNPATGTLPVRVDGNALNAGNNASAACDGGGRAVSLAFNGSGQATAAVLYADAGRVQLNATYTGSGADAGLVMNGSDTFTVAPYDLAVSAIPASLIAAGSAFSATVTARNYAGTATPNFGRESAAEGATLGFVRSAPTGSNAVSGSFSGSLGAFSGGAATASNLSYSEVGTGNVGAVLASGSYLGSGMTLAGSSEGALVWCGNEGDSCVLPTGSTVTMYYQAWGTGRTKVLSGLSGTVACNTATFGDPYSGWGKGCVYAATGGVRAGATAAAQFKPHHFDVAVTPACGAFTYGGQPFAATVTARNAANATTVNYDGSLNTSPNFAKATTLADVPSLGVGSLAGGSVAASAFVSGVASASPTYTFTNKQTTPRSLVLRATDSDGASSAGFAEPTLPLRSGRLRLASAYGKATAPLQLAVAVDYWSANAWVLNNADSCTTLAAANVALSNGRNGLGSASAATSAASAVSLSSGQGTLTLAAPTPAGSGVTYDVAINLGSSAADQSCHANHPATTGAAKPWLRSLNGNCAATWDRDPAGLASFGIYTPESRKTVHVRELF